ncbi:MAG: hypothetical protein EAZ57_06010 [Cytophagales bacterium]|nr:MAG: hypothetical protein EAZ67_08200 [Cytophagales bacterium]TAF60737.1 MAG: hypothetical protein EAZ57_06010 [Cytophagales bacterium]
MSFRSVFYIRFVLFFVFSTCFLCPCWSIRAQIAPYIQWADQVIDASSALKDPDDPEGINLYAAKQALGKPNKLPDVGSSRCAWSPASEDSDIEEWIHLSYKNPMPIRQIAVAENFNPGAIARIYLYDTQNKAYLVYENKQTKAVSALGRMFHVILNQATSYDVQSIKIVLNSRKVPGYNEIDAMGITLSPNPIEAKINLIGGLVFGEVEQLPATINSPADEVLPIISPDGKTLFFTRKNHPKNHESDTPGTPNDDIWVSYLQEDGSWKEAVRFGSPLNNGKHNFVCATSADNQRLLLGNGYKPNGDVVAGVSMAEKRPDGSYSMPRALIIEDYYNESQYSEYALCQNGQAILMAIKRKNGYGDRDLYVSFLSGDGTWLAPMNIGKNINTAGIEFAPFMASDNKTLYFSSTGHSGFGRADVFMSRRLDDTWVNWSEPVNLGPKLNSSVWDAAYSVDDNQHYVYFSSFKSNEKNKKNGDIFRVGLPNLLSPEPVATIVGTVYHAETLKPLGADILFEDLGLSKESGRAKSDSLSGKYKIVLPLRNLYGLRAEALGYLSVNESINLRSQNASVEIRKDLYMSPIKVGQIVVLNNVFFTQSKELILSESFPELDRIAQLMQEKPSMTIELIGHTDIEGEPIANFQLSERRVKVIKEYLVSQKIAPERITLSPMGSTRPLSRERDEASKQQNRRVEFKILKF